MSLLLAVGCVRRSETATVKEMEEARSRVEQGIGAGEPTRAPWHNSIGEVEVHVEATLKCSGFFWKKQFIYARAYMTGKNQEGPINSAGKAALKVWIYQDSGLFAGLTSQSTVPSGPYAEAISTLEGNFWSNPCGCATVTAEFKAVLGHPIMDKRVLCAEGHTYNWAVGDTQSEEEEDVEQERESAEG